MLLEQDGAVVRRLLRTGIDREAALEGGELLRIGGSLEVDEAVPPLFVFELDSGDIEVAANLVEAERSVEPYDVEIVEAIDASGRRYRAETRGLNMVFVATEEIDHAGLEARLRRYVADREIDVDARGDYVVGAANALVQQEWEGRFPKRPRWLDRRLHGSGPVRFR